MVAGCCVVSTGQLVNSSHSSDTYYTDTSSRRGSRDRFTNYNYNNQTLSTALEYIQNLYQHVHKCIVYTMFYFEIEFC